MHYGLRCYNKDGEALGWLYTYNNGIELVWTIKDLDWCKRWKTERGAKKNFERYNSRWQFKSTGGYLKIEVMPDIQQPDSSKSRASKLLEEWGDNEALPPEGDHVTYPSSNTSLNRQFLLTEMFNPSAALRVKSKEYMTQEQQNIAEEFLTMVETEYALCIREIKRANAAIIDSSVKDDEESTKLENTGESIKLDFANREINSISKYWQLRLLCLIEFIETKNPKINAELAGKYLV